MEAATQTPRIEGEPQRLSMQRLVTRPSIHHVGISGGKDSTALLLWARYESGIDKNTLNVTFSDTGNEHWLTYEYVRMLSAIVHPVIWLKPVRDFYELANHKKRFPSPKARFCTTELKLEPARRHVLELEEAGHSILLLNGVRAAESEERASLPEREIDWYFGLPLWRPLLKWTLADVWAIHDRHGLKPNPLYEMGAKRVGCFPCIMSRKKEIANIYMRWPERITELAQRETEVPSANNMSTFFARDKVPMRYRSKQIVTADGRKMKVATILDVARWAMDGEEIDKARAVQERRQTKFRVSDANRRPPGMCLNLRSVRMNTEARTGNSNVSVENDGIFPDRNAKQ